MSMLFYVLLSTTVIVKMVDLRQTEDCVRKEVKVECNGEIPATLPNNVTEVYVKDYGGDPINKSAFQDVSWLNIEIFHVHIKRSGQILSIGNYTFSNLVRLVSLKIRAPDLRTFGKHAFVGLDNLTILDLSDCISLEIRSLVSALNNESIAPSIDTLLLDGVGNVYGHILHIDRDFFQMIFVRNITKLSLANTNCYAKMGKLINDLPLPIVELNISHANFFSDVKAFRLSRIFGHVRVLDASGYNFMENIAYGKNRTEYIECASRDSDRLYLITRMERIYANNMLSNAQPFLTRYVLNASNCPVNLKLLSVRESNIYVFNMSIFWPMSAPTITLDMSGNAMRYFNIQGHMPVYKLILSGNRINQMETDPDFVNIFRAFPLLEELLLDNNGLHSLPKNIFLPCTRLKYIHLQGNRLSALSVDVRHLQNLRILNLRENKIAYMDAISMSAIDSLQTNQLELKKTTILKVDLRSNEIECSCGSYEFIRWVWLKYKHTSDSIYNLSCHYGVEQSIQIDSGTLSRITMLCKRPLIIAISSSISVIVSAIAVGSVLMWYVRMKKRDIGRFIEHFSDRKTRRYLALVSHSKSDSAIVFTSIRQRLEGAMRKVVPVEFDLLCLGDIHFTPGMALVDEIHKSVAESFVAIFVISQSFCESGFCLCELKEAYAQNKPIILMFLEEVDEQAMPPLMHSIFSNFSRVKLTVENGNVVSTPSWDSLTQSILTLASFDMHRPVFLQFFNCLVTNKSRAYNLVRQY